MTFIYSLSTIPSSGCNKSDRSRTRDGDITGQMTWGWWAEGHSQVLQAHLQAAANGVQVYLGAPRRAIKVPSHTKKGDPWSRNKGSKFLRLCPRLPAMGMPKWKGVTLVFGVTHTSPSQDRICKSREEAASPGMNLSHLLDQRLQGTARGPGRSQAFRLLSPPLALSGTPDKRQRLSYSVAEERVQTGCSIV